MLILHLTVEMKILFNVLFKWLLITTSYFISRFDGSLKCYLKGHVLYYSSHYDFLVFF
jgi:hypothetical protein